MRDELHAGETPGARWAVREARADDADALVRLATAVGSEEGSWLIATENWRGVTEERRYLKALRRYPHAVVYVAEDQEEIVGRLSLARDVHPASAHVADLGLMVAASHRRLGIGRALLERAVVWSLANGVRKIELHVFPWNEAAIALYEAFGFEREGYRKAHYLRDGEYVDAILMAYALPPSGR
jgi:RimJ/RimL family protein N-acetyltransferase